MDELAKITLDGPGLLNSISAKIELQGSIQKSGAGTCACNALYEVRMIQVIVVNKV